MAALKAFRTACKSGTAARTTAWDFPSAVLAEESGMDLILIGDSTGVVALGLEDTVGVTLDEIIYHARAVARGAKTPFRLGDLPLGSYEKSPEHAVDSSLRLIKEGKCHGVKLEGGREMAPHVAAITRAGVPVIGNIGLTPQRALAFADEEGEALGTSVKSAMEVMEDALALQGAGAVAVVLEAVAGEAARVITRDLRIPTIGIGCGATTSTQIALQSEILGYQKCFLQKWHKQFADIGKQSVVALKKYKEEVQARKFPAEEHTYEMREGESEKLKGMPAR